MNSITAAALAEIAVVSYRSAVQRKNGNGVASPLPFPLPSEFVAVAIIYGALHLVPGQFETPAAVFGWGIVAATLLNLWDPATIGNQGGVAVKGGPSTKTTTGGPTVSPSTTGAS